MRKTINALTKGLQKLNFANRFFKGLPEPDFNVKGIFCDKEFIEPIEIGPYVFVAPDIEYTITDLRLRFPG
jgi:hypothetical protein